MKTEIEEAASKYVEEWHIDMGWVPTERSCIPSVASFTAGAEFMQSENEKLKEANHTLALALVDCKKYNGDITKIDEIIREALKKISE